MTTSNLIIRRAQLTDAVRIAALSEELGYPADPEKIRERLEKLLPRPDQLVVVAEATANGAVGWAHAAEQHFLESRRHCEILGLVVASSMRGKGIGRLLINEIEHWAAQRGLEEISVRSNVLRQESHPFYERIGFTRVKTQHVYRKGLRR